MQAHQRPGLPGHTWVAFGLIVVVVGFFVAVSLCGAACLETHCVHGSGWPQSQVICLPLSPDRHQAQEQAKRPLLCTLSLV